VDDAHQTVAIAEGDREATGKSWPSLSRRHLANKSLERMKKALIHASTPMDEPTEKSRLCAETRFGVA
jgi:hypothetical protein